MKKFIKNNEIRIKFTQINLQKNNYFIPDYAKHRPASKNMISGKLYEPFTHKLVKSFFKNFEGSMVHAGTFFGDMLPNFSQYVSSYVYAFEPVFENYCLAKLCIDSNNLDNVILLNCALSDEIKNLYIDTGKETQPHRGGASFISNTGSICSAMTIDNFKFDDLGLIHLDVEGHELRALNGAVKTIELFRPLIVIEDNNNDCGDFLKNKNYINLLSMTGLKIWAPEENSNYIKFVKGLKNS